MAKIKLNWFDPHHDEPGEFIGNLPITIGRDPNNTIALDGVRVSRNHARIASQDGQISLTDLGSSNGIGVRDKRLKGATSELKNGDHFVIDPFEFTFSLLEASKAAPEMIEPTVNLELPIPLNKLPDNGSLYVQTMTESLTFPANTVIFRQGEATDGCYILDAGLIRLELNHEKSNPDDQDDVLTFIEPGTFVGEQSLLDRSPRSASAIAHTNVQVRKISLDALTKLEKEYPNIAIAMLTALGRSTAEKLRQTTQQLDNLTSAKYDSHVETMIADAAAAQQELLSWSEERIDALLEAIAMTVYANSEALAEAAVEETGIGNVVDKTLKNRIASMGVYQSFAGKPGYGILPTEGSISDVIEIANPVGIVFGLIPVTNPTSTFVFKVLISLKARNALILSPNRRAANVSARVGELISGVLRDSGAPEKLVQWIDGRANRKLTVTFMGHKRIGMILATGGGAMVKAAYSSGNPAIGVGSGNAPTLITDSADLEHAAQAIVMSKSFDNGLICGSEHNLVVVASVDDPFRQALVEAGSAILTPEETEHFMAEAIDEKLHGFKEAFVGKDAAFIAKSSGIQRTYPIKLIVIPTQDRSADNPLAREKMLPVLSLFSAQDIDEAFDICDKLLTNDGQGHTAIIHTQDESLIQRFSLNIAASRILVNSPGSHGVCGISTNLIPSLTLGCGTFGGTSTTDNITYKHLMNIKRLAYFVPERLAQFLDS